MTHFIKSFFLLSFLFSLTVLYGQNTAAAKKELRNDSLFLPSGSTIVVGQKVKIGEPAAANGRYRSIISKYAAVVPRIWGPNPNYENDIENHVDNKKGRKQMSELKVGDTFTIKKISLAGNSRKYHYYIATLSSEKTTYRCDIGLSLQLKEVLMVE
jgi:hypothetical protein